MHKARRIITYGDTMIGLTKDCYKKKKGTNMEQHKHKKQNQTGPVQGGKKRKSLQQKKKRGNRIRVMLKYQEPTAVDTNTAPLAPSRFASC